MVKEAGNTQEPVKKARSSNPQKSISKINKYNHERHERHEKMVEIIFKEECYVIQGAIYDVYREMGCGFLESVYQECLGLEFQNRSIPFIEQKELTLKYKNIILKQKYKPDFICFNKIIVELKAVHEVCDEYQAQIFNYLKAADMRLGILVNFGHYPKAEVIRIVL